MLPPYIKWGWLNLHMKPVFSLHNLAHVAIVYALGLSFNPLEGFLMMLVYEILEAFKPWHKNFRYDNEEPAWWNWLVKNFVYSNKLSVQDIVYWNLSGALLSWLTLSIL